MRKNRSFALPVSLCATAILFASTSAFAQGAEPQAEGAVEAAPAPAPVAPTSTPAAQPAAEPAAVAPAPAPAPQAEPPVSTLTAATSTPAYDRAPDKAAPTTARKGRFFFVPRIGIGLGGNTDREETESCSAQYSGCDSPEKDEYKDSSRFVVGADALFNVSENLRLGVGTLFVPSRTAEDGDLKAGSDLSAFGVAEVVIDASPTLAFALRGQLGAIALFPGGDLQDDIDSEKQDCTSGQSGRCEVGEGPFVGLTYGIGAGVIAPLGGIKTRVDVLYHAHRIDRLREKEDHGAGGNKEEREKITGHQVWLLAGLEL